MMIGLRSRETRRRKDIDYSLGLCYGCDGIQGLSQHDAGSTVLACFDCHRNVHAACSGLTEQSALVAQGYDWQCNECKSCLVCQSKTREEKIILCTLCDRGYHVDCFEPPLKTIPTDDWYCSICSSMPSPSLIDLPHSTYSKQHSPASSLSSSQDLDRHTTKPLEPISDNTMTMMTRRAKLRYNSHGENSVPRIRTSRITARLAAVTPPLTPPSTAKEDKPSKVSTPPTLKTRTDTPKRVRLTVKESNVSRKRERSPEFNDEYYETFGYKLSKTEASTRRSIPTEDDKVRFEEAKRRAEVSHTNDTMAHSETLQERSQQQTLADSDDGLVSGTERPTVPKIEQIQFGDYLIDTWYVAPYPEEYSRQRVLYICEYCMKYMKNSYVAGRHKLKCPMRHPPGDEIYRQDKISIFEIDGRKNKMYCQNLCLLAKMFLDHKTLYYDVEPFLFYIMTEVDERGCHFVGYFSKEKRSAMDYNVSCILTLPIYQRKGYGQYLIDFSYLLTKREGKMGTPERPLSDLGLLSYRSYWKNTVFRTLRDQESPISIDDLSHRTGMTPDDIISTLQTNRMLRHDNTQDHYVIDIRPDELERQLQKIDAKGYPRIDPSKLTWAPFVLSMDRLATMMGQTRTIKPPETEEQDDVDVEACD